MFIVILCTLLEVIKCRLKIQHNVVSPKTHKEKKPLNVSLHFFYFIFYKMLQGMKKKS